MAWVALSYAYGRKGVKHSTISNREDFTPTLFLFDSITNESESS